MKHVEKQSIKKISGEKKSEKKKGKKIKLTFEDLQSVNNYFLI